MILIIGAHRDAPVPSLGPSLACRLAAAIRAGKLLRIVVASGQPRLITPPLGWRGPPPTSVRCPAREPCPSAGRITSGPC